MPKRKAGKLGMIPKPLPEEIGLLSAYLVNPLGPPPASLTWPASLQDCGMGCNDSIGDCTIVGAAHVDEACALIAGVPYAMPADPVIRTQYFDITGGADRGCVEANVLKLWHTKGLFAGASKLAAFAPLNIYDTDELKAATALFGATYVGIKVPTNALTQFEAHQPWHLEDNAADDRVEGGHCIVKVGFYVDSVWGKVWGVLTWGTVQLVTEEWLAKNILEDWAPLSQEFVQAKPGVINVPVLQADIAKLAA